VAGRDLPAPGRVGGGAGLHARDGAPRLRSGSEGLSWSSWSPLRACLMHSG
jgi:hypothetical protein